MLGGAALLALAAPGVAHAAQITAGPAPSAYGNPNIEIEAGEAVTFMNLDLTASHDVTSTDVGPGAQPLFSSATVGFGTTVPVTGAETLDAGTYDFLCSIHTFMAGSIRVRGGGGGGGSAPSFHLSAVDEKLGKVDRSGKLRVRVKINEAATVQLAAKADGTKVATGKAEVGKGSETVAAKLTRAGKRMVAKAKRLKLEVTGKATDADGDSSRSTLDLKLR